MTPAERIEELEAEVEYLRSELGLSLTATRVSRVVQAFGISPNLARMLIALADVHPKVLARGVLFDRMEHYTDANEQNSLTTYTYMLRKKLGKDAVVVTPNVGIGLSGPCAERVRRAATAEVPPAEFAIYRQRSARGPYRQEQGRAAA